MITEYVPAGQDFSGHTESCARKPKIGPTLDVQRIETGIATNVIADQLLKARTRENVLALMSATVPMVDEDSNTSMLASLFQIANVLREDKPGIAKLQNMKKELSPFCPQDRFS